MPLPEGYLPHEGDVLAILAKVRFDVVPGDDDIHVELLGANSYKKLAVPTKDVDRLVCRHWEVGDKVMYDARGGEVLAVVDDMVWVKFTEATRTGEHEVVCANWLEPCPASSETEQQAEPPPGPKPFPQGDDDGSV